MTKDSPEYLLKLMSQIIDIFLSKLNVPQEEVDTFTNRIKERKMGELFKHFRGWDVQALRREIAEAKEETEREREIGIHKLLNIMKKCHIIPEDAMKQLMEEYHLSAEEASEKIALYW